MKKLLLLVLLIGLTFALNGCVPNDGVASIQHPAGFFFGYWHGLIMPITFVWSLFNHNVHIYEVINNGNWYNFGFLLGAASSLGGVGHQLTIKTIFFMGSF